MQIKDLTERSIDLILSLDKANRRNPPSENEYMDLIMTIASHSPLIEEAIEQPQLFPITLNGVTKSNKFLSNRLGDIARCNPMVLVLPWS